MYKQFKPEYPKFNEVVAQAVEIVAKLNLAQDIVNQPDGQIAIQSNELNVNNHRAGIGKSSAKTPEWEQSFCHLQPKYKDTAIAEYLDWLNVSTYRTRIMLSRPKTCYSIHNDYSPRLHLPLVTNDQCYFLFTNPEKMIHMPADGKTYWVDTREYHTFLNGSTSNRLHLVMIVKE
jgi:hypothetical protein